MIAQLADDIRSSPEAFRLTGPESSQATGQVLRELGHPVLGGLRDVWDSIGGGDLFHAEMLLGPSWPPDGEVGSANEALRARGLSDRLLIFHAGTQLSAIDHGGAVVEIDEERLEVVRRIGSLDDWYAELRRKHSTSYGLGPAQTGAAGNTAAAPSCSNLHLRVWPSSSDLAEWLASESEAGRADVITIRGNEDAGTWVTGWAGDLGVAINVTCSGPHGQVAVDSARRRAIVGFEDRLVGLDLADRQQTFTVAGYGASFRDLALS